MDKKQLRGSLLLTLTALIWGTAFVAQTVGMEHIGPFTFNAVRTLLAGVAMIPVILIFDKLQKKPPLSAQVRRDTLVGGVICGTVLFVASSLQQSGIEAITENASGKAGFITALYIIIVPLIGLLLGKRPRKLVWLCVVLAIIGFYLLCVTGDFSVGFGELLVLGCAVGYSLHILVIDHFSPKVDGMRMSCIQFFVSGALSAVAMFLLEEPTLSGIWAANVAILYTGIMSSGVGYTLQIVAQKDVNPTLATMIMSVESVFAVLAGWLLLHEDLSGKELLGCLLVFIAVILAQLPEKKKEDAAA
jgi:drug/metabolite transporter (DMT)-like permease